MQLWHSPLWFVFSWKWGNCSGRHFWSTLTQYATNSILTLILRDQNWPSRACFKVANQDVFTSLLVKGIALFRVFLVQLFLAYTSIWVACSLAREPVFVIFFSSREWNPCAYVHTQTRAQTTHTNPAFLPVIGSAHKVSFSVSPQQLEKLEKPVSPKALV